MKTNIELIAETLKILGAREYIHDKGISHKRGCAKISLKLSKKQMSKAIVITEEQVKKLVEKPKYYSPISAGERCKFFVSNSDSFAAAMQMSKEFLSGKNRQKLLVLNFANPVVPGGGVRRGAQAQEEDLCRKSTLLASLESKSAEAMYSFNKSRSFALSSDYMILSPKVEIFRDGSNALLKETSIVSVLTSPAPYIKDGADGMSRDDLEKVIYHRIIGMLHVALAYGYKHLVLGAWGCGAFGNDAEMVARSFYKAFKEVRCGKDNQLDVNALFRVVNFAVLHDPSRSKNYECFHKYFSDFHRDESEEDFDYLLSVCIDRLIELKEVIWQSTEPKKKADRTHNQLYMSYPIYPAELRELFWAFPHDSDSGAALIKNLSPEAISEKEIYAYIDSIWAGERFCDGHVAGYIESGEYLELLLRLRTLRDSYYRLRKTPVIAASEPQSPAGLC